MAVVRESGIVAELAVFGIQFQYKLPLWLAPLLAALLFLLALAAVWLAVRASASFWRRPWSQSRWLRYAAVDALLLAVAAGSLSVALALPQWGYSQGPVVRHGRDLVLVVDVSRSMLAEDVTPNRLQRAKADLSDVVAEAARYGDCRVGLVAFAGVGRSLAPLTESYDFVQQRIEQLEPGIVYRGGSYIETGLREALSLFDEKTENYRDILLVTDGDDFGSDLDQVIAQLRTAGVTVHVLVRGNPEQEAEIPVYDSRGGRRLLRYRGQIVRTRAHAELVRDLAEATGGLYVPAFTGAVEADSLYQAIVRARRQRRWSEQLRAKPIQRFQWFALPAVAALLVHALRWCRRCRENTAPPPLLGAVLAVVALLGLGSASQNQSGKDQQHTAWANRYQAAQLLRAALRAYERGAIEQAIRRAEEARELAPTWWLPSYEWAVFQAARADWLRAAEAFQAARRHAPLEVHPLINFGIGTALLKEANNRLAADRRADARRQLERSIRFLEDALSQLDPLSDELADWLNHGLDPNRQSVAGLRRDIRTNLELARRLLDQLSSPGQPRPRSTPNQEPPARLDATPPDSRQRQRNSETQSRESTERQPRQDGERTQGQNDRREESDSEQMGAAAEHLQRRDAQQRLRAEVQRLRERERHRFRRHHRSYVPRAERDW